MNILFDGEGAERKPGIFPLCDGPRATSGAGEPPVEAVMGAISGEGRGWRGGVRVRPPDAPVVRGEEPIAGGAVARPTV